MLGKLPVPGRPTIWITVSQGPTTLVVGAGGGCLDIFTLVYPFSPLSPSLWETARYRLKYCLKGPLNPKPTNQPNIPVTKRNHNINYNISMAERNAIKTLANYDSIIIKKADKGGAVVIMDKETYKKIVETMLSDTEHEKELRTDPSKTDKIKYSKFLKKYRDLLKEKEFDYLINFEMKLSNFYGLPKVHKSTKIKSACKQCNSNYVQVENVDDLALRPIVAGPACQTHRLSNSIDILLRPLKNRVSWAA